jgi:predicted dehydrogenase
MRELRIGLIGAGWMGRAHAAAFRNARLVFGPEPAVGRIVAVADVDLAAAQRLALNHDCERPSEDWRAVVDDPAIDLVDITTPNNSHFEIALAAIDAGKHVYCEKPLTIDARESGILVEAAARAGVITMVGYNYTKNPIQAQARALIEAGELGDILSFRGTRDQDVMLDPTIPFSWRHDRRISGSGALGDMGTHALSLSQMLVGDIAEVCGNTRIFLEQRPVAGGGSGYAAQAVADGVVRAVENDDMAQCLIRYRNGALGSVTTSRVAAGRRSWLTYQIQGTRGALWFTQQRMNELRFFRHGEPRAERGFKTILSGPDHRAYAAFHPGPGMGLGYSDQKAIEVHDLLCALAAGRPAEPDFAFGHRIGQVVDAILLSDRERRWVRVDEVGQATLA